jgi:hypothetical protein
MTFAGIAGHNQPRPALIKWLRTAAFKRGSDTCANQVGRLLLAEGPIRSCFHKADIRANWRPSSAGSKGRARVIGVFIEKVANELYSGHS